MEQRISYLHSTWCTQWFRCQLCYIRHYLPLPVHWLLPFICSGMFSVHPLHDGPKPEILPGNGIGDQNEAGVADDESMLLSVLPSRSNVFDFCMDPRACSGRWIAARSDNSQLLDSLICVYTGNFTMQQWLSLSAVIILVCFLLGNTPR
jgi:hypothetical protein